MKEFSALRIMLASPEDVLSWSYGEVQSAETINYRSLKPEQHGLMCEAIFGPVKSYECYCGKYKKSRYKGIICDKCGVEIVSNRVRRERMGHLKLAIPVTHVWYLYGVSNVLSLILNISSQKLISVVYYLRHIVLEVDVEKRETMLEQLKQKQIDALKEVDERHDPEIKEKELALEKARKQLDSSKIKGTELLNLQTKVDKLSKEVAVLKRDRKEERGEVEQDFTDLVTKSAEIAEKVVLTEDEYRLFTTYELEFFKVGIGASAVQELLRKVDIEGELKILRQQYNTTTTANRPKLERKIKYFESAHRNNYRMEWMVTDVLPVIPADLRPIIQLAGGRFAISGLNDLYRRVISRNKRLKGLMSVGAPEVILRNEKRMLQESVDALIDNLHRPNGRPVVDKLGREYKSLAENLRGKEGRFRRNLLGKRVDYSGRAVIIPDSSLSLNQCGLPRLLALEMYKPFVIHQLINRGVAENIRIANEMIDQYDSVIWDILEEEVVKRPVLLNRAPSFHKYSMQAFFPVLVEGAAIRVNQLICRAFNADFDGDTMAVFLPLGEEAVKEATNKIMTKHNILLNTSGEPIIGMQVDMVIGLYYLTSMDEKLRKEEREMKYFASIRDAIHADEKMIVGLQEPIKVLINEEIIETTVGRLRFNEVFPKNMAFVNERVDKSRSNKLLKEVVLTNDKDTVVEFLDDLKNLGFRYATLSGYSISLSDIVEPEAFPALVKESRLKEKDLRDKYYQGLSTAEERDRLVVELWRKVESEATEMAWDNLPANNPIRESVESGANGSPQQVRQILTMKGVARDPNGNWIITPILGNFKQGLGPFEFFIAGRGNRKGMADSRLRLPAAGYLGGRLADVAQDLVIKMIDCGYKGKGLTIKKTDVREINFADRLVGRYTSKLIKDQKGKIIARKNVQITNATAEKITKAELTEVQVRSPIYCEAPLGLCQKCYGQDLSTYKEVEIGVAVGIVAAQAISEPASQMTLNIFKKGGVGTDITAGFPRIEELFESRNPKFAGVMASISGQVLLSEDKITIKGKKKDTKRLIIAEGMEVLVKNDQIVKRGEVVIKNDTGTQAKSPLSGKVRIEGNVIFVDSETDSIENISVPEHLDLLVEDGAMVEAGEALTDGHFHPTSLAVLGGLEKAQLYILDEVQKVHKDFGISVHDKHIELMVRQMIKITKIVDPGGSGYIEGEFVSRYMLNARNKLLIEQGLKPIIYSGDVLFGIGRVSLNTDSVLSAMSFERVVQVLTDGTLMGRTDYLRGLKENTMIGRLIPVGENAIIEDVTQLEEMHY